MNTPAFTEKKSAIILGIDPGTRITGYGIVRASPAAQETLDFGCIRTLATASMAERYLTLFQGIEHLIERYKPEALAVETQFVYKNPKGAMTLGMARGMAILAAARAQIPVYEYAPKEAKLAVVGNGAASKSQVQKMIQLILKLPSLPEPEDAADALALALCHAHRMKRL